MSVLILERQTVALAEDTMANGFVWFHNGSEKPADCVTFYEKLLGWKGSDGPAGMTMLAGEGAPFAAVMPKQGRVSGWVPYVQVEDVAAATKRAVKLGAELLDDVTRGPAGSFAIVRDPGGATVALWQKA
jgi:predicted enzyme related to lactoylglutathione lyase